MNNAIEKLSYTAEQLQELNLDIVEILPDAVIVVNQSGQVVLFNARAELLFGYSRREVVGKMIEMLIPEVSRVGHVSFRTNYLADPTTREMGAGRSLHAVDNAGDEFHVNIHLATRVVAGIGRHTVAVVRRTKMPEIPAHKTAVSETRKPPFGSKDE